jgi:rhombotail lipoprotein
MKTRLLLAMLVLPLIASCASLWHGGGYEKTRQGASSSLVDYLYPEGEVPPPVDENLPILQPPLRVGIAFVPSQNPTDLSAAEKEQLLEHVADAFRDRDYVKSIDVIPDTYMRSSRGIHGMQQVAALYGEDVMALVSYDQLSFSGEKGSALLYWTIIGAVTVKGNTNEVQTMIDTAVFDVPTAKLLFRAPGMHTGQGTSTFVSSERDLRELRSAGFVAAADDMIGNLDAELEKFREATKGGERAQVQWKQGSGGGGGGFALPLLLLLSVAGTGRRR